MAAEVGFDQDQKTPLFQSSVHHVGSCRGLARWTSSWKCVYGSRDVLDRDEEGSSGDKGGDVGYIVFDHGEDGRAWGSLPWPRRSGALIQILSRSLLMKGQVSRAIILLAMLQLKLGGVIGEIVLGCLSRSIA